MAPIALSNSASYNGSSASSSSGPDTPSTPRSDAIAICGLACRLPGSSSSPSAFWDLISKGSSGKCRVPPSRFNVDAYYHEKGMDRPGSITMEGGYFLEDEDIRNFDNSFFGINNLEATYMDPQQRKLLEVVFECLENAGVPLDSASGSNTGCYVGNFTFDYMVMQTKDSDYLNRYSATGLGTTILSNRISHVFNLLGPSLVIDTACSSSLYCLHTACVALANYECDAAVVAGANLIQSVEQHMATMKAGVLSPTSQCHTFDSSADGYGRGEGIGALYVKRLDDAIRDGDPIRSVIRGSAVNANGKTTGISLPSAEGQESVIRKAMLRGGVEPEDISYIECHGTGTVVGDAIEVDALSRVFRRSPERPLLVGSVKSNVGHSEAASGIAGVLKATLALEKGLIPPIHGLRNINPKLKVDERHVSIPTTLTPWPDNRRVRRIGINSFGYGGANAHVIVEEAPRASSPAFQEQTRQLLVSQTSVVLPLSAASPAALEARVADLANFDFGDTDILDLAYTLGSRRTNFPVRGFMLASRADEIASSFVSNTLIQGGSDMTASSPSPFAFIFTGQGSQWAGMCRELVSELPVFRNAIAEMDSVLKSIPHSPDWSLHDMTSTPSTADKIHSPEISQPLCTAIQVALVQLLASWGMRPTVTAGHSSGEIAAAFAAGHVSAAEAIVIAYYRGYCVAGNRQNGAMMAVGLSEESAAKEIEAMSGQQSLRVACINSPEGVTISGDAPNIDVLHDALKSREIFARKLLTGGQAYHSHHMQACGHTYQSLLEQVLPGLDPSVRMDKDGVTMVSSVTCERKTSGYGPRYWRRNLESPVRFAQTVQEVQRQFGPQLFFAELGPHSSLELPIKQSLAAINVQLKYAAPLKRNVNAMESTLSFAGNLWLHGQGVDWYKVNGLQPQSGWKATSHSRPWQVVKDLPRYRFDYGDKAPLWTEPRISVEHRQRKYPRHELLGSLQPGGSGKDFIFRNMLGADDVSWVKDHRVEDDVVFAGAGYLCMAIEAVMQVTDADRAARPSFTFSNVNISNALLLSEQAELFTSLRKSDLSNATTSSTWWDFTISTYQRSASTSVVHAKGRIAITSSETPLESKYEAPAGTLEATAKRIWYSNFVKSGLNYGPCFQPIAEFQTPRMKSSPYSSAKTSLLTAEGDASTIYPIHPISLDAAIQLCIVATANGVPKDMRAQVPTRIASMTVNTVRPSEPAMCRMNALAKKTGFASAEAGAELIAEDGSVLAQFEGLRLAVVQGAGQGQDEEERNPILRVLWKPDVYGLGLLSVGQLESYAQKFADEADSPVKDDGLLKLGAMLDLLVHKNPQCRILELGNSSHDFTVAVLEMLHSQKEFKRLASYSTASFAEDGSSSLLGGIVDLKTRERCANPLTLEEAGSFDLVIMPHLGPGDTQDQISSIVALLSENAVLIALGESDVSNSDAMADSGLNLVSFPVSSGSASVVVAHKSRASLDPQDGVKFVIVERDEQTRLGSTLADLLRPIQGHCVSRVKLSDLTRSSKLGEIDAIIPPGCTIFNLCELKTPLLATTTDDEMLGVKMMTDHAGTLIWITSGNALCADRPEFSLAAGMSRAISLEQPSLKFYTYDIDTPSQDIDATAHRLVSTLHQQGGTVVDREFVQHNGVVHVSRFVPDDGVNAKFRSKQGLQTEMMPLSDAGLARLHVGHAGQFDTLFLKQQEEKNQKLLHPDEVHIKVASVGVNAKDYYVLAGRVDTPSSTCQLECAGTVVEVGSAVTDLSIGDAVVAMAPTHFQTYQRLPQWACHRLQPGESFDTSATLPLVYATAIYALNHRAKIKPGETLLVHSGAGGVGIAVIQLAKLIGAKVFTTVSTEEKRRYLVDTYGLDAEHIFSSSDTSFLEGVLKATSGRGVDVIVNSLTGDQLHATWRCSAPFGRFVEIGKMDLSAAGRLDMAQFLKNTTFSSFDLSAIYAAAMDGSSTANAFQALWKQLLTEVMSLYRQGLITAFDHLQVFDVTEATQAFRSFSSRSRIGKIAINLEKSSSTISVQPIRHATRFSPNKSYVMIGCLGGLGRTLSRWMVQRGARKFAFLGRSGMDKPAARELIQDLEMRGAESVVVRGDVCEPKDVEAVVARGAVMGDIGGVVQAAMGLNEAIFSEMPNKYWHTGIDPKVQGTRHLYNSLRASNRDAHLDFFLMTSSVSGTVGTATESNYCAANHFLDAFARHLRTRPDRPVPGAFALGLGMVSEVGYLHDNPEIEALLLRKGIQAIDADELVQIVDLALSSSAPFASSSMQHKNHGEMGIHHAYDGVAASHMLTGMEAFGLKELRKQGFDGTNLAWDDPRAAILANALDGGNSPNAHLRGQGGILPAEVVQLIEESSSDSDKPDMTLADALLHHVRARFGNLVLLKFDAVDVRKPLSKYGMDSMIAAEFKTWFYKNMGVDISLLALLDKTSTLERLRDLALEDLEKRLDAVA